MIAIQHGIILLQPMSSGQSKRSYRNVIVDFKVPIRLDLQVKTDHELLVILNVEPETPLGKRQFNITPNATQQIAIDSPNVNSKDRG